jgi:hypothetical protein
MNSEISGKWIHSNTSFINRPGKIGIGVEWIQAFSWID